MSNPLISADDPGISEDNVDAVERPDDGEPKPMSKNASKKAAKAAHIAATRLVRRAREKEARKTKKRILAEKRAAGEPDKDDDDTRRPAKKAKIDFAGRVVVDLGFDEMMSDKVRHNRT
jgi:tRNA (guanine9-N1)-methyltransferase